MVTSMDRLGWGEAGGVLPNQKKEAARRRADENIDLKNRGASKV